jgi:hypothetical protein
MEDKHAYTPVGKIENPENIAKAPKPFPPPSPPPHHLPGPIFCNAAVGIWQMRSPRTVYVQDLAYLRIYEVKEEFCQQNLKILQILIKNVNKKTFVCSDLAQSMYVVSESGPILFLQKFDLDPNPGFL